MELYFTWQLILCESSTCTAGIDFIFKFKNSTLDYPKFPPFFTLFFITRTRTPTCIWIKKIVKKQ